MGVAPGVDGMAPGQANDTGAQGPITPKQTRNASRAQNTALRAILEDPVVFSRQLLPAYALRDYQTAPASALMDAIVTGGQALAAVFSRQSGKDELLAQVLSWFLSRYQRRGGSVVVAAPTMRPQAIITRDRLIHRLEASGVGANFWRDGTTVGIGRAMAAFVSAGKDANTRGLTASSLLVANEAQDIDVDRWDAVFAPMTASTNASTLYMGTEFDGTGLLARQVDHLRGLEREDGRKRVYFVPWQPVAAEVPAYAAHYADRVTQLGEDHPLIRTEYWLERLEDSAGLFPPDRVARMQGSHPRKRCGVPGKQYALLLDVGGEEERTRLAGGEWDPDARRDATALTVVEISQKSGVGELPIYDVVDRQVWTGIGHVALATEIERLARNVWGATALAIDATGIGAGLAAVLADRLQKGPKRCTVYPVVFGPHVKSKLGWGFVGIVDAGRYREYGEEPPKRETAEFWRQVRRCVFSVRPGETILLSWGARSGEHDDLLLSAALVAILDEHDWRSRAARGILPNLPGILPQEPRRRS